MGAFDGELYSLGYRFNSSKDEPTKPKEDRLPDISKYTLLELLKKHNIQPQDGLVLMIGSILFVIGMDVCGFMKESLNEMGIISGTLSLITQQYS